MSIELQLILQLRDPAALLYIARQVKNKNVRL